jgi:hypothetical protein
MKTAKEIVKRTGQALILLLAMSATLFLVGLLAKIIFKLILTGWNVL